MKICLDVRSPGESGVRNYMRGLVKGLLTFDKKNQYVIITDPNHRGSWSYGVEEIVVPSLNPLHWMFWSNTTLVSLLQEKNVDVYHTFKHVTAFSIKTKRVVTLHGLHTHYLFPQFYKWYDTIYWKTVYSLAARNYDRLVTVAGGENKYLVKYLGFPENKFRVTYLAHDARFKVLEDKEELKKVKENFNLPDNYILFVGRINPIKNIEGIIRGYQGARPRLGTDYKLVIVGGKEGLYFNKMTDLARELKVEGDVIFLGHVNQELPQIYNLASLFLLPSHYEGFGIVLLEAMACGVPVVTSNIEDICEVVGNAAILVDPSDVEQISQSIVDLLSSPELYRTLIEKGLERSSLFSWERCARETVKVYEELL